MVKFINGYNRNGDAENIMNMINAYVMLQSEEGIYDTLNVYNIKDGIVSMQSNLLQANCTCTLEHVSLYQPCTYIDHIKIFIKKVIRKLIRWYVDDTIQMQNEYNAAIVRYENDGILIINELINEITHMRKQISELNSIVMKNQSDKNL